MPAARGTRTLKSAASRTRGKDAEPLRGTAAADVEDENATHGPALTKAVADMSLEGDEQSGAGRHAGKRRAPLAATDTAEAPSRSKKATTMKRGEMDAHIDAALMDIDIHVDRMRAELEECLEGMISELRRTVDAALVRTPSSIRAMNLGAFLADFGGRVASYVERTKTMNRVARTVAKGALPGRPGGLGTAVTGAAGKTLSRIAGALAEAESAAIPSTELGHVSKFARSAVTTPTHAGRQVAVVRSRVPDDVHAAVAVPAAPSMATMKSAVPPTPGFNPLLPKTPATRRARRGEVVHAFSENGSPLGAINVTRGAARGSIAVNGAAMATATDADLCLVLEDGSTVQDEGSIAQAAAAHGSEVVLSAIMAMEEKLRRFKAAAAAATAQKLATAAHPVA